MCPFLPESLFIGLFSSIIERFFLFLKSLSGYEYPSILPCESVFAVGEIGFNPCLGSPLPVKYTELDSIVGTFKYPLNISDTLRDGCL